MCAMAVQVAMGPAWADESAMLRLLRVLHARGSITTEEFEELQAVAETEAGGKAEASPKVEGTAETTVDLQSVRSGAGAALGESQSAGSILSESKASHWYDRLSIRGYVQMRYHLVNDDGGVPLNVPADRSVSGTDSFLIRRGRLILSGDVGERVFVYVQPDMNASPTDGQFSMQLRDLYADVALDAEKEFRIRVGQSKVPFGFVNMQSSQNRMPLERADALNSAVEGERDLGAFLYWAPSEIRDRFRHLVASGLKGSGDYGVAGLGVYSGQGLNRSDRNGDVHVVGRLAYPWELPGGQYFETALQAYTGRFVVDTEAVTLPGLAGVTGVPEARSDGIADERIGVTAVWYPQPFGIEAEWNWGRGPTLSRDRERVESDFLHGGYVQVQYRLEALGGVILPFARWQRNAGGRKFARNAPDTRLEEVDAGIEWSPLKELEIAITYTHTFRRTNTRMAGYPETTDAHRVGFQVQWNY